MKSNALYDYLETEFGRVFKRESRRDGCAYYWHEIKKQPASTRLIRIAESATGDVAEIKLAQSSIGAGDPVFLPLPASGAEVAEAVRGELAMLLAR